MSEPRLAVIDNYDSFTYNLVQYLAALGPMPDVFRNDEVSPGELASYSGVVISPGPGTPGEAGISTQAIRDLSGKVVISHAFIWSTSLKNRWKNGAA